ncbi:hypothetical protein FO519_006223 [Halicephalobus sp. NKZ332]|nr:hypothetical protein FO519_006223 [Halicephalobus sp. NKZ332]
MPQGIPVFSSFDKEFLDLLLSNTSIEYIKLIVSSLNYSKPGFSRLILETALTATDDQSRKWCTRFLGVLAGSNVVPDFGQYGMKLLISQLGDSNIKVVRHAVRLLHVWLPKYPEALAILARTVLEPLGSAGILLKAHLFGSEKLVQEMEEEAKNTIEFWMENYQKEYINIIEEDMRVALLNIRRSIDGSFARPSSERFEKFGVPMPVHLFSQLSNHQKGRSMLVEANVPSRLFRVLIENNVVEEDEILDVKAALLSIGHIASNLPNGLIEVVLPPETIPVLCRFAEECPTLSIRGTAIWSLSLVGKSEDGARLLAALGWESNRHVHVVDEVFRPDRTFTHESVVTSGFGSAQDEAKQTGSIVDLHPSSFPKLDQKTESVKIDEAKNPKKHFPFAPSTMPDFTNPVIPNPCLFSLGFGESSCMALSFESEKSEQLLELTNIDREKMALSELTNQPHFSTLYRKHHGIQGFDQECVLNIPNRTNSQVTYVFLSRTEMKNVEKYERMLMEAGEWVPTELPPEGQKGMTTVLGWSTVSLPAEVGLKNHQENQVLPDAITVEQKSPEAFKRTTFIL